MLIEIVVAVVVSEFLVMLILPHIAIGMGGNNAAILDALLLAALSGPCILWRSLAALKRFEAENNHASKGPVQPTDTTNELKQVDGPSKSSRPIKYLIGLLILGTFAFSIILNAMLERIRVGGPLYASIVEQKELVADILPPPEYVVESYLVVRQIVEKHHRHEILDLEAKLQRLSQEFEERQRFWSERLSQDRIRDLLVHESSAPAREFFEIAFQKIIPLAKAGDYDSASVILSTDADDCYLRHRAAIDELTVLSKAKALAIENSAEAEMRTGLAPMIIVIGLVALGAIVAILFWMLTRHFYVSTSHLESRIATRTLQLEYANREIRELLDSVEQGFLKIDYMGRVGDKYSEAVIRLLGEIPKSRKFSDLLARHHPATAEWFALGLDDVFAGVMPLELTLDQLPKQIESEARWMSLRYFPVFEGEELTHIVIVVSDITADVQREKLEVENREFLAIVDRMASDQFAFLEFIEEAESLIDKLRNRPSDVTDEFKRAIHTLKGNAAVFGLARVSNACHAIEDHIADTNQFPSSILWTELFQAWATTRGNLRRLMIDTEIKVTLGEKEYSSVLQAIINNEAKSQLAMRVASWRLEPTRRRLENIAEQAISLGTKLGKGVLNVSIEDSGLRTDPKHWSKFWSSIVHVIRNAVDHGIETVEERRKLNKPDRGTITLSTSLEIKNFVVSIGDDGRGIDWGSVRKAAQRRGLECESESALQEAIFQIGVSTCDGVTETSGRGVGLSAIRESCRALGGIVEIHSIKNLGSEFRFVFPIENMARDMHSLLKECGVENPNTIVKR